MKKSSIVEARKTIVEELIDYKGEPVKFDIPSEILEEILFDHTIYYDKNKVKKVYKNFAYQLDNDYLPCDIIRKIDFTGVSFKDFQCSINFKGIKGVTINPQEMYKKDLSLAILDGVTLDLDERGLDDVYLSKTSFKGAKVKDGKQLIINPQTLRFRNLASCILDGVMFNGSFDRANVYGANFEGSIGACLDPQTLISKCLEETTLKGVLFINTLDDASIKGANFEGSIGACINPQTIRDKSFERVILKDAIITNKNMDGAILNRTDFTGVIGEVEVNPQTVCRREILGCNLFGVKIIGMLDGCVLLGTTFKGSTGAYVDDIQTVKYDDSTKFADAVDITNALNEIQEKEKVKKLIKLAIRS